MPAAEARICRQIKGKFCKDRISALPEDLLVQILSLVSIKDAVATMILSKRWRFVWTMVPKLEYTENNNCEKSVWEFLDNSLQLHKAPFLESLRIQLGQQCPADVDVGKWVSYAVDRCVQKLELNFYFQTILPKSLYTCKTLVKLTLARMILVDVPSPVCLPSLESLELVSLVYKDQDSHVRLLSSCPVLKELFVVRVRNKDDNVTSFTVKVPSLQRLTYEDLPLLDDLLYNVVAGRSLVIDSPGLNHVIIVDPLGEYCSFQNMPRIDVAFLDVVCQFTSHPNDKFLRSFSSAMSLDLFLTKVSCCSAIKFPRLIEFKLCPYYPEYYWLESLMLLLHNTPKLQSLMIDSDPSEEDLSEDLPLSWNQPSSVPVCLLSHLEIFEWKEFGGRREEKQFVAYILANSKCLKTVGISPRASYSFEEKEKMMEELKSMSRVSASSKLLFSAQLRLRFR